MGKRRPTSTVKWLNYASITICNHQNDLYMPDFRHQALQKTLVNIERGKISSVQKALKSDLWPESGFQLQV